MSQKKSTAETTGYNNSTADRASRDSLVAKTQGANDYFSGPSGDPTQGGLYKTLMATKTDATNRAYNDAKASTRLHSNMAGFGYTSPIAQGSDAEVESQRASDLAKVPGESLMEAIQPELTMQGITAGEAGMYGQNAGTNFQVAANAEQQRLARKMGLFKAIAGAGLMAAAPFTGGATLAPGAAVMGGA